MVIRKRLVSEYCKIIKLFKLIILKRVVVLIFGYRVT